MFGFTTSQQIASNVPKTGGISSGASAITGGLSSLLTNAISKIGSVNKPQYSPEFYIHSDALFPNGVTDYTQGENSLSGDGSNNNLFLYGGLGLAALVAILVLKK